MFGIIEAPETLVELLLLNPETAAFLSSRRIHPTQRFRCRRDGATLLTMKVRGPTELASWISSLAPWVTAPRARGQLRAPHGLHVPEPYAESQPQMFPISSTLP